jgi:hypothetical protein
MAKIRLDLDDLSVESFEVSGVVGTARFSATQ